MELTIRRPDDFHVHLRDGGLLDMVLPFTSKVFARALVMPNLTPPITTADEATKYRLKILLAARDFQPLMSIKLLHRTTPRMIVDARAAGVVAGKLYPAGVTTNADDGVKAVKTLWEVFKAMEDVGMVLCLHAESPGIFSLDREEHFLHVYLDWLTREFPKLKIVVEHLSSSRGLDIVRHAPETVAASITAHHLLLTLDDVLDVGGKLDPHAFCKPICKAPTDRTSLVEAATSGHHKWFFGSDSAPHPKFSKECAAACAGVFSAPVALPVLAEIFESKNKLSNLEKFVSENGANFYGLPLNTGTVKLVKEDWEVPADYGTIVPLRRGKMLSWKVA